MIEFFARATHLGRFAISLLVSYGLSGCGSQQNSTSTPSTLSSDFANSTNGTSAPQSTTQNLAPPTTKVTKFGAMCPRYGWVSKAYQEAGWDVWPYRVDVYLATSAGEKGENIFSWLPAGAVKRIGGSSPVVDFPGTLNTASLEAKLNSNLDKQAIIECTYGDYATSKTQTLGAMIAVNQMDSKVIIVSPFTEIVFRAKQISASRKIAMDVAEATAVSAIETRFPLAAVRLQPYPQGNYDGLVQQFDGNTSAFFATAMALYEHAYSNFRENISAYARLAASAALGDCSVKELCMAYQAGRTQQAVINSEFASGRTGWRSVVALVPGHVGALSVTTEGIASRAILELSPNDTRNNDRSRLELSQRVELSGRSLSDMLLVASASNLKAGSTWINNFAASGITGAFLCFEAGNLTLGCYLAGYHFDAITIPIKVGEAFKIQSTSSFAYDYIRDRGFLRMKSLQSIADSIPDVSARTSQITAATVGALAGEATASVVTHCYLCFSRIEVDTLGIEILK